MSLTILTAYTADDKGPWSTLAGRVLPALTAYAKRHGYGIGVLTVGWGDTTRAYPWQKTEWVRDFLRNNPDVPAVWVLDIDTLITNPEIALESFMDDAHDLFIGEDINGINSGSYILRNTPWALHWIDYVLGLERHGATSENHAMMILSGVPEFRDKTRIVEGLNSIPYERYPTLGRQDHPSQWAPGHLLMHLPGMTPADRVAIFKEINP